MKFTLGQIGQGRWGKILNRYFTAHPGFEVKKFGGRAAVKEVLADPAIQAVVVATPLITHYPLARRVLESGKHLFVEKPFTQTSAEALALQTLAQERNLKVLVDHTFTFSAAIAQMRELIERGEIGEISAIHLAMCQWGEFKGVSAYHELGVHMLSVLNLLVPLSQFKLQYKHLFSRQGIVETGMILFEQPVRGQMLVSLNQPGKERKIIVFGEKGSIIYDMLAKVPLLMRTYDGGQAEFPDFDEGNHLQRAVDYFYQVLCKEKPSNLSDAIAIAKVLERAG